MRAHGIVRQSLPLCSRRQARASHVNTVTSMPKCLSHNRGPPRPNAGHAQASSAHVPTLTLRAPPHNLAPPPRALFPLTVQSEDTTDPNRTPSSRAAPPSVRQRRPAYTSHVVLHQCKVNRGANGNPIVSVQHEPQLVLLQPLDVGGTTARGLSSFSFWYCRGMVEGLTRSTINKKLVAWAWAVEGVSAQY
jgi:hypothetical protein